MSGGTAPVRVAGSTAGGSVAIRGHGQGRRSGRVATIARTIASASRSSAAGGTAEAETRGGGARGQGGDDRADYRQRLAVVGGEVVGDAGDAGVELAAAQFLGADVFAGRRFHQGRAAEEDRPLL